MGERDAGAGPSPVLHFGLVAEATGVREEVLSWEGTRTPPELRALLEARHPVLSGLVYRIAVDQDFVPDDAPVACGVELALLPPFSGG